MGCPVWNTCQRTRQGLQFCTSCFLTVEHDSRKGTKESGTLEGTNYTGLCEPTLYFYHIFKDFPSSPCLQDESKRTSCYYFVVTSGPQLQTPFFVKHHSVSSKAATSTPHCRQIRAHTVFTLWKRRCRGVSCLNKSFCSRVLSMQYLLSF